MKEEGLTQSRKTAKEEGKALVIRFNTPMNAVLRLGIVHLAEESRGFFHFAALRLCVRKLPSQNPVDLVPFGSDGDGIQPGRYASY